jgi:hypothetical protein
LGFICILLGSYFGGTKPKMMKRILKLTKGNTIKFIDFIPRNHKYMIQCEHNRKHIFYSNKSLSKSGIINHMSLRSVKRQCKSYNGIVTCNEYINQLYKN